jgi:ABC-type Fe3+-hydroxamate transport system substrate-binding protein
VNFDNTEIKAPPNRVVCLSEITASSISALGYKEFIVGAPEKIISAEKLTATNIGAPLEIYKETVVSLKPDVVIASFEIETDFKNLLSSNKIPFIKLQSPKNIAELKSYYTNLTKLFVGEKKKEKVSTEFWTDFNKQLETLKAKNEKSSKKALLYIDKGFVATEDSFFGDALKQIGINNVAAERSGYIMSDEDVAVANPEIIFCPLGMSAEIMQNSALAEVAAVKNGAVYEISVENIAYCGTNFIKTLEEITNYIAK